MDIEFVEYARFDMLLNESIICSGEGDQTNGAGSDQVQATCGAAVRVVEGAIFNFALYLQKLPNFDFGRNSCLSCNTITFC